MNKKCDVLAAPLDSTTGTAPALYLELTLCRSFSVIRAKFGQIYSWPQYWKVLPLIYLWS